MNATNTGKIFGWAQFGLNVLGQALAGGLPVNAGGWLSLLGSLAAAVGVHAASSTDGTK
jgi:hypothetical protein